ncbi:GntR family transcriptional regulator [Kineococcus aurantiacus]|uniref:GntR family transcriptional regulator n=1 Tax=Kineococcus aurantiacus TaxID=37633 RepID=A0A7Y9DMB0_9ACTN|nr:GntR family transcriptional regulator [Kineococcus aurantiacus]NYD23223.1 GntR family transcriptional regulator [Kineococcus aurantiacus]
MPDKRPLPSIVRDQLMDLLRAQGFKPGDRLPSEAEISRLWDVGRSSVREALKLLEQEGLVQAERGRGRFLSSLGSLSVDRPITRFESATQMLASLGRSSRTMVLSVTETDPSPEAVEALGLAEGERVVRLERLRSDGDDPLIYSVDTIPAFCIPGPVRHVDWTGSLTELLAIQGHLPVSSAARLQAVELPEQVRTQYHLDGFGPWLLITETAITTTGRRVLLAEDYHRGDAFTFNVLRR